jgi:hypothetical protein
VRNLRGGYQATDIPTATRCFTCPHLLLISGRIGVYQYLSAEEYKDDLPNADGNELHAETFEALFIFLAQHQ